MASWDDQFAEVRSSLRAAQREVDALSETRGMDPSAAGKRRAAVRKSLVEVESVIRALRGEAKDEPNAEHRREMERRVDMLKQQKKMVLDKLSGLTGGSNSSNILDALKKAVGADRSREEEANNEDMFDDRDDATLLDMQNDAIVQQDAALARLSNVISKQKMVGQAIMGELDSQNEVLEMVEEGVTASTGAVRNETKRVGKLVDATSKDNKVTLVICLLILVFVVVLVAAIAT
ncbi:Central apparatus associated protein C1a-18 [Diplonema papillatum]|nr:Central apparatus associated protein C1a-18 [Diplonema papillatum]